MRLWAQLQNEKRAAQMSADRRVRKIRRFFWHFKEDSRLFLWMIVLFLLGALFLFFVDASMGAFR